jgi:hypothetical protein
MVNLSCHVYNPAGLSYGKYISIIRLQYIPQVDDLIFDAGPAFGDLNNIWKVRRIWHNMGGGGTESRSITIVELSMIMS